VIAYEILLMLDPELPEKRQEEIVKRARDLVKKAGGKWVGHDVWGRRRLAYEIQHKPEGTYHLLNFDAEPETLEELSRISASPTASCATSRCAASRGARPARRRNRSRSPKPSPSPPMLKRTQVRKRRNRDGWRYQSRHDRRTANP
jgi:small subunit ribosomal protein S6